MIKKCLLRYYNMLDAEFHFRFMEILRSKKKNAVHDLRVNIKKQMAFFDLLQALDPAFKVAQSEEVMKAFFTQLAKVRNIESFETIMRNYERKLGLQTAFTKALKEEKKLRKAELVDWEATQSLVKVREVAHHVDYRLRTLDAKTLGDKIVGYFECSLQEMEQTMFPAELEMSELHEHRKTIKRMYYNLVALDVYEPGIHFRPTALQALKSMESLLGDWHDLEVVVKKISKEKQVSGKMVKAMQKDMNTMYQKAKSRMPALQAALQRLHQDISKIPSTEVLPEKTTDHHITYSQLNLSEGLQ